MRFQWARSNRFFVFIFTSVWKWLLASPAAAHKYFSLPIKLSLYLNRVNWQRVVAAFHLFLRFHHDFNVCFCFRLILWFQSNFQKHKLPFRCLLSRRSEVFPFWQSVHFMRHASETTANGISRTIQLTQFDMNVSINWQLFAVKCLLKTTNFRFVLDFRR